MSAESEIDFLAVAVAHKFVSRDDAERCQLRLERERLEGNEDRTIEEILREEGLLTEEETWAVYKARDRMLRDARQTRHRIGPYEVVGKLGEGGLGVVYKARQLSLGREVALKLLHEKWMADEEFRRRFLLEARLVGRLNHPNLIQVIDVGRHKNSFYYSMEYVDGETVDDMIEREGPLPVERAVHITAETAKAIAYLAQHDIVHRDIKPGNIMVASSGAVKLGDFGFVKSSLEDVLSTEGEVLGTPDYMSPEVARGDAEVDVRSDVYSLGATLYHMLAGRPPFGGTSSAVMEAHIKSDPIPLRSVRSDLSDLVCIIVEKMMAKDVQDRYATVDEMFEDLDMLRMRESDREEARSGRSTILRALDRSRLRYDALIDREATLREEVERLQRRLGVCYWVLAGTTAAVIALLLAVILGDA